MIEFTVSLYDKMMEACKYIVLLEPIKELKILPQIYRFLVREIIIEKKAKEYIKKYKSSLLSVFLTPKVIL